MKIKIFPNHKWIILAIIIAIWIPIHSQGQNSLDSTETKAKRFRFGYGLGFNVMGLSVASNPEYVAHLTPHMGINFHVAADLYLNQRFDLMTQAGILFNQRDINIRNSTTNEEKIYQIESNILEFPIALKYKFLPKKNRTRYLLGSLSPRFDLSGKYNVGWQPPTTLLRSFDVYPEIGYGLDYQLRKLKFGIELKFSMGLLNVNVKPTDPKSNLYSSGVKGLHSNMIILCFNFE